MSLSKAAELLGLSPTTLRAQIDRGALKATKAGPRAWIVTRAEVERYRRENLGHMFGRKPK